MNYQRSRVTQVHGVAVSVNKIGVLILGDSGTGKSAAALELIRRGHKLIADDAVLLKIGTRGELIAEPHTLIAGFLEIRGFGVVAVAEIFGESAVAANGIIQMFAEIEPGIVRECAARNRMGRLAPDLAGIGIPRFMVEADRPEETAGRIESKTEQMVLDRVQMGTAAPLRPIQVKHYRQDLFVNR